MSDIDSVEEYKRDCHARWMLDNMPAEEIRDWLKKQPAEFREDMRQRLNTEREKRSNRGDINPNHPVKTHQQRTLENDDYVGVNQ